LLNGIQINMHPRRWLLLLLLIGFVALVTSRFTDAKQLVATLSQGQWQWVLVAIILHVVYFVLYAVLYQVSFNAVEVESRAGELMPVLFASLFVNAIAPTGGAGGAALFIDDAVQRGQSGARTTVGTVLVLLADLGTLIPFVIVGLIFLSLQHELQIYGTIGAVFFLIFILILTGALLLARWRPGQLRKLLRWFQRAINRIGGWFKHPDLMADDWAAKNAGQFAEAAIAIAAHPKQLNLTLALALVLHVVNLAGLYVLFLAFQQSVRLGTLVAGFGMGIVFFVISIFQGAGVVEGIMTLVFTSAGIPKAKAIVIALTYRGLSFWLPLLLGFFFLRRVRTFNPGGYARIAGEQTENGHEFGSEPS
jgi:uncharacterized protein (TIRG00374 family)